MKVGNDTHSDILVIPIFERPFCPLCKIHSIQKLPILNTSLFTFKISCVHDLIQALPMLSKVTSIIVQNENFDENLVRRY